jgi:hypothetical protein
LERLDSGLAVIPDPDPGRNDAKKGFLTFCGYIKIDGLVKSQKTSFFVIPAKAGIQCFQKLITDLDPGFRRGDDFLRVSQDYQPKQKFP